MAINKDSICAHSGGSGNGVLSVETLPDVEETFREETLNKELPINQILCGDNRILLGELPADSIDLVITSPPYYQQRYYGGGMGNETTPELYIAELLEVFKECLRVIKPTGSVIFNIGDKYINSNLMLLPYRFAIQAQTQTKASLINEITWVKQNPTPRQYSRRLVSSTEPFFHFVKSKGYYYDIESYRDKADAKAPNPNSNVGQKYYGLIEQSDLTPAQKQKARVELEKVIDEVKSGQITNFRMKIKGIHAEAFGGQSGGRKQQMENNGFTIIRMKGNKLAKDVIETPVATIKGNKHPAIYPVKIVEKCIKLLTPVNGVALDPFMGSGSTAIACKKLDRQYIGFDINPDYCEDAIKRVTGFAEESIYFPSLKRAIAPRSANWVRA